MSPSASSSAVAASSAETPLSQQVATADGTDMMTVRCALYSVSLHDTINCLYGRHQHDYHQHQPRKQYKHSRQDSEKRRKILLAGLVAMLSLATMLAIVFVPRDEHSPRMMFHPLSSMKHAKPQSSDSIRYLTFGSASTWGDGLEDPQQQAYPFLLSSDVHNAAARVGGLSLSAICTQSIVGNHRTYDVIVVEYKDEDADSVIQLAVRLRQRFPSASLVFVHIWSPATHIVYQNNFGSTLKLMDWWHQHHSIRNPSSEERDKSSFLGSFEFQSAILSSDPQRWSFVDHSEESALIESTIQAVGGHILNVPLLSPDASIPTVLTTPSVMSLFQADQPTLLSPKGHQTVAQAIKSLLQQENILDRPNRHALGSWGNGDACNMWYATGDASVLRKRRRASLVDFSREDDGVHKHAVEISRHGGSLDVTNPFEEPRMLYLTYMTAAIQSDSTVREYPRTKISLDGKPTLLIDPVHDRLQSANNDNHLTRTTAVGLVPPGRTVLRLDSLDATSTSRFRLVGLHFLNKGKVPIPFEFEMEPDAAHR